MSETTTIRRVAAADSNTLGALWLAFLEEQASLDARVVVSDDALDRWNNDFPSWIARDSRHILVAQADGGLVGFAAAVRSATPPIFAYVPELYVEELYVAPDVRRRGIGRALQQAVSDWAASWGARRLRLSVLASNEPARAFWQALGFNDFSLSMTADLAVGADLEKTRERGRIGFGV